MRLLHHPRAGLAVRTALAATLAWQLALWLPGETAATYPYFAPLGAVVGSWSTVRSSVRNSASSLAGIILGALLALTAAEVLGRGFLVVPVVVFLATLLAGWRVLGEQRTWVLTVSLFVLTAAAAHPVRYAAAYCGLTLLGGVVAIAVNALFPRVPLAESEQALQQLSSTLADQLDDLAEGLRRDEPPSAEEWRDRVHSLAPVREALRARRLETEESLLGNVRRRRVLEPVRRQHVRGVSLANLSARVEELSELLVEVQTRSDRAVSLPVDLRWPTAAVLTSLSALLRADAADEQAFRDHRDALRQEVQRLSAAQAAAAYPDAMAQQTAGAVVTTLRRCLGSLGPDTGDDGEAVAPTPWRRPDPVLPGRDLRARTGRWVPRPGGSRRFRR
ncbi:uncharacterized membrane protein YgaE (UPF0421/DUF939 family) [Kineococcus radiotolerans]|uniref:Uncharacterized membrane protein YgaE (UPF0421/DUF939 family) n=1 Tax=Kineococcus radiotolerans TaxID=131568 RepID=A0A7W4TL66_KINRA|nr:aromatic acid exporter family protein [Kineococcus radiotolerans]MBB2900522.1 uncharacterized membrane protein YgaE (UPF0421/DUF939 family) [Kineococcus radiotolerans]